MKLRIPIWTLMTAVLLVAVIFASLKNPNTLTAGCVTYLTVVALLYASVGAIVKRGDGRLPYLGFAVFGLGFYILYCLSFTSRAELSNEEYTLNFMENAIPVFYAPVPDEIHIPDHQTYADIQRHHFARISLSLIILLNGVLGSILARFFGGTKPPESHPTRQD